MMKPIPRKSAGFTLIELMIAMAIVGFIMMAIYAVFASTSRTQSTEQVTVELQQDIRAGFMIMQRELRSAGFDATVTWPTDGIDNDLDANIDENTDEGENNRTLDNYDNNNDGTVDEADEYLGFTAARSHRTEFRFISDTPLPAPPYRRYRTLEYHFAAADADSDGIADAGAAPLRRDESGGGDQIFIENAHAIAFAYAFDAINNGSGNPGADGLLDVTPNGNVIWAFDSNGVDSDGDTIMELDRVLDTNDDGVVDTADTVGGADITSLGWAQWPMGTAYPRLDQIRAVRIWLLARSRTPLRDHTDSAIYVVGPRRVVTNDNFKRRLFTSIVWCPNLPPQ